MAKTIKIYDGEEFVSRVESAENAEQLGRKPSSDYALKKDIPTSLPANGGNASTVGGFTVGTNVPSNAKFTDTVYTHPAGTNPHGTTKANVGLGNVLDYGIATTAEAQAGTSNVKYMTPALVKAAVDYMAKNGGISMVKSVQRGVLHDIDSGATRFSENNTPYVDVTISPVNVSKAFIIVNAATGGGDTEVSANARLVGTTTLRLFTTNQSLHNKGIFNNINWQVIEYM